MELEVYRLSAGLHQQQMCGRLGLRPGGGLRAEMQQQRGEGTVDELETKHVDSDLNDPHCFPPSGV